MVYFIETNLLLKLYNKKKNFTFIDHKWKDDYLHHGHKNSFGIVITLNDECRTTYHFYVDYDGKMSMNIRDKGTWTDLTQYLESCTKYMVRGCISTYDEAVSAFNIKQVCT